MANPKRRHSNTRTRLRRAHDFLTASAPSKCSHCGAPVISHRICPSCGYYRDKQVITIKVKEKKAAK
ncbi:MAG: 50S ribosomal protein L32 [Candidatus Omnitrophica bacterium]|nr:50S ribosomal protein L32 [Candidatus Omnitrophota bacterium]